ncbi:hypothetical protein EDB92DRAFT_2112430 [Lactarius akahatsu]|uniref:Uncharacterized protein n=1 Tax=Lactarius akahatsu TaxID=416441 RepID=A0AAD4LQJ6_9AGAM|nr:hypothetical protein EDB92DRAFT_2112430 [Lactarius akahatsu]
MEPSMIQSLLDYIINKGLSKSARTARSCASIDLKIEEYPRLPHRAGYPHRFCARHDVLGSTHGAHRCTVQPRTRAAAAASHPCVKSRRRTPPHRSTSGVSASCCTYSHVTPAPYDEPTVVARHEASRRSLKGLRFPADLIPRMVEADPVACASLDEVLAHWWMDPTPGPRSLLGTYKAANATTYAALRWPEKVGLDLFYAPADDAWRKQNFADILELVARLCEAPNTRRPT